MTETKDFNTEVTEFKRSLIAPKSSRALLRALRVIPCPARSRKEMIVCSTIWDFSRLARKETIRAGRIGPWPRRHDLLPNHQARPCKL